MSNRPEEVHYDFARFAAGAIEDRALVLKTQCQRFQKKSSPKSVHQIRVASRRLREALCLAYIVLPETSHAPERAAKSLRRVFGEVRTKDSLAQLLFSLTLPEEALPGRDHVMSHLTTREKLIKKAKKIFKKKQIQTLVKNARLLAKRLRTLSPEGKKRTRASFVVLASEFVGPRLRALLQHMNSLPDPPSLEALHQARILVKKLRYAWEVLRPALAEIPYQEIRESLAEVQEAGGLFHDLELLYLEVKQLRIRLKRSKKSKKSKTSLKILEKILWEQSEEQKENFLTILQTLKSEEFQNRLFAPLDPGDPANISYASTSITPHKSEQIV